jgi:hypothetical protein
MTASHESVLSPCVTNRSRTGYRYPTTLSCVNLMGNCFCRDLISISLRHGSWSSYSYSIVVLYGNNL